MDLAALQVRAYKLLPRRWQVRAVRHATPNFTVGSLALLTSDGQDLLLVRPTYRQGWLPPGGFLNKGETPAGAVAREVGEELGVEGAFRPHHRVAFDADRQVVTFMCVGVIARGAPLTPRSAEIEDVRWFSLEELPDMPNDFSEGLLAEDLAAIRRAV